MTLDLFLQLPGPEFSHYESEDNDVSMVGLLSGRETVCVGAGGGPDSFICVSACEKAHVHGPGGPIAQLSG